MKDRRLLLVAFCLLLADPAAPVAMAGQILTITTDFKGGWEGFVPVQLTFQGVTDLEYAGAFVTTVRGGPSFDTFCIDLYDATYPGSTWQANVSPIAGFAGNPAGDPAGGNGAAIGALYSRFVGDDSDRIKAAALQISIWKVEYDGTTSLSTGRFQVADSSDPDSDQHRVYQHSEADLSGFDPATASSPATLLAATSHPDGLYQDLVGPAGPLEPDLISTPEPGTLGQAIAGLVALAVVRLVTRRLGRGPA